MADSPATNGAQADIAPSLNALAQYAKDFSFENPNAPRSLQPQQQGPQINLQVNVNAKQLPGALIWAAERSKSATTRSGRYMSNPSAIQRVF